MSFRDFPEQQQPVSLLQRSLDKGRVAHAYLFAGFAPVELESVARTLAKTLNCRESTQPGRAGIPLDSCDRCLSCQKIENDNHPDVQWIRPESKTRIIGVDQIRDLVQRIHLKPTEAEYKLAIISGADRLNAEAANAFLKTLEEPPPRSILILLTTEPNRLLDTIVSRCLRLNFSGEANTAASRWSEWVGSFGELAARAPEGLLSRYRLLGALLTRLSDLKSEAQTALARRSPLERYSDVDSKLRSKWEDELEAATEAEYRRQRAELLLALQWWLRDIWLQTTAIGPPLLAFPRLAELSRIVAARLSSEEASENLHVLDDLQRRLATNVQEALALEVALLKLKL